MSGESVNANMEDGDKFCLRLNEFESKVNLFWRELQIEEELCDVTLASEDQQIRTHRIILYSYSPVFRNILKMNQNSNPFIYLRKIKHKDLQNLVNFMYQGEVSLAEDDLASFLEAAEDLQIRGLSGGNHSKQSENEPSKYSIITAPPSKRLKEIENEGSDIHEIESSETCDDSNNMDSLYTNSLSTERQIDSIRDAKGQKDCKLPEVDISMKADPVDSEGGTIEQDANLSDTLFVSTSRKSSSTVSSNRKVVPMPREMPSLIPAKPIAGNKKVSPVPGGMLTPIPQDPGSLKRKVFRVPGGTMTPIPPGPEISSSNVTRTTAQELLAIFGEKFPAGVYRFTSLKDSSQSIFVIRDDGGEKGRKGGSQHKYQPQKEIWRCEYCAYEATTKRSLHAHKFSIHKDQLNFKRISLYKKVFDKSE